MRDRRKQRPVDVAVLDTNVVKGTSIGVLEELRRRGWRLRVSDVALIEMLAHLPEKAVEILPRLARLGAVLDPAERIAPTHATLVDKLGGRIDGLAIASVGQYATWKRARGSTLDGWTRETSLNDLDPHAINVVKGMVDEGERDFTESLREARRIAGQGVDDVQALMRRTANSLHMPIHLEGGVHERLHLYFSLLGLHGARAVLFDALAKKGRSPRFDPNSSHDTNIAQHLAEGVFIVTDDRRFIVDDVDATGSFQAPWVRTPWEMLTAELPHGFPWGRGAKRIRDRHTPRTIDGLREIERLYRSS